LRAPWCDDALHPRRLLTSAWCIDRARTGSLSSRIKADAARSNGATRGHFCCPQCELRHTVLARLVISLTRAFMAPFLPDLEPVANDGLPSRGITGTLDLLRRNPTGPGQLQSSPAALIPHGLDSLGTGLPNHQLRGHHSSRSIAGCLRFFTLIQCFCLPPR
jgi:hypothetical protein